GRRCPLVGVCFSEVARSRAAEADLVIANHALYFADLGIRELSDGLGVLPEHDAVVFDEAHRLEDSAASWLGGRVSGAQLAALARRALDAAANVESCRELDDLARVAWAEPDAIAWAPVDVSSELRERLWDVGPTAILVSATLGTDGDFGFVRDRLGLRDADEL